MLQKRETFYSGTRTRVSKKRMLIAYAACPNYNIRRLDAHYLYDDVAKLPHELETEIRERGIGLLRR